MDRGTWTVAQAKAKLSEIIENALAHGPQTITRNGRRTAVVVDAEEWARRTKRSGSLADFFKGLTAPRLGPQGAPLKGSAAPDRRVSFLLDTNVVSE